MRNFLLGFISFPIIVNIFIKIKSVTSQYKRYKREGDLRYAHDLLEAYFYEAEEPLQLLGETDGYTE